MVSPIQYDPEDIVGYATIMDSIEAHWATTNHDISIDYHSQPIPLGLTICTSSISTNIGIHTILT
jgi:hypothetical protein